MRLAVSNIAWTLEEEPEVATLLRRLGVSCIELAPTKRWPDLAQAPAAEVAAYRRWWEDQGFEVVAVQSILFGRPELVMFGDEPTRNKTLDFLKGTIELSANLGAKVIVFGSPKNRQRGELSVEEADAIAVPFFRELGETAASHGVVFCIEPNAPQYACDYVTTAAAGAELVAKVGHPGFGLHLDAACMSMAGDQPTAITQFPPRHFHVSAPMLSDVPSSEVPYAEDAAALKRMSYQNIVSIEMRSEAKDNAQRVERAVRATQAAFFDGPGDTSVSVR